MEQLFFNLPISELESIFKGWVHDVLDETNLQKGEPIKTVEQLLTVQQAAEFLNLTVPTIYSKVSKGELPVMKRSKRLYFSKQELIEYLKAGRKKTNAEIEAEASQYLINKKGGSHE